MSLVGAIVRQQLRRYPRRRSFYIARTLIVSFVGGAFLQAILYAGLSGSSGASDALGLSCFSAVAGLLLAAACLVTPWSVAPVMAEEKEDHTLEALMLAGARPREILIGKLVSAILPPLLILAAAIPLMVLSTGFGGLRAGQIARTLALLLTVGYAGAALGLLASTLTASPRKATLLALGGSLFLFFAFPALLLKLGFPAGPGGALLEASVSPFAALDAILTDLPHAALPNMGLNLLLGTLFLADAFLRLPHLAAREITAAPDRAASRPAQKGNPLVWKETLALPGRRRGLSLLVILAVTIGSVSAGAWMLENLLDWDIVSSPRNLLLSLTGAGGCLGFPLAVVGGCALSFGRERRQHTLDILLITPLPHREIILGRLWAPVRRYWPLLALGLVAAVAGEWPDLGDGSEGHGLSRLLFIGSHLMAVAAAAAWALFFSLRFNRSVALTLTLVLSFPWILAAAGFANTGPMMTSLTLVCSAALFNGAAAKLLNRLSRISERAEQE